MNHTYNVDIGDLNGDRFPDIVESNPSDWNLFSRTRIQKVKL
ncbi:MAG: hypothetical protein AB8G18_04140 [Gammaproteobacteria bacterium]